MKNRTIISLVMRNLFFLILQPGIVVGIVPFIIAKKEFQNAFAQTYSFYYYAGLVLLFTGLLILIYCVTKFALEGLGTLSPADPTTQLVISGLYKFSRNPMYVGVLLILFGEVIFSKSVFLLVYSIGVFALFHIFIVYKEEPRLKKDFGEAYETYSSSVRRWV